MDGIHHAWRPPSTARLCTKYTKQPGLQRLVFKFIAPVRQATAHRGRSGRAPQKSSTRPPLSPSLDRDRRHS
ncbi:hypothetical protein M433DRAFT_437849 [Acidomyces richmondensis BFW]|nr:MAG: hypothetical protein FE78DRAFT_446327 [Acidomyces sp. 'richmondensis']KYG48213.1 hypothetical protein M433DRAFT_437849 [Acidomyces richmondensis BFW]